MVDHLVESDGQGAGLAGENLAEGIADESDVDAGFVQKPREEDVICSERDDAVAALLHLEQLADGDAPLRRA